LGESKFPGPCLNLRNQLVAIELSTVDRHIPIVESTVLSLRWQDEAATQSFALQWATCSALRNAFVALHGNLGAGKTTLVRHLLSALGVQGRIKSPTYAVVEPYELPHLAIWHFDFYRFNDPEEWEDAGFRDIFSSPGLKLAEWPEKVASILPVADVDVHLRALDDGTRQVDLRAHTPAGAALLAAMDAPGDSA
jgi:tRNA threonylcarbamoyladenosine biosynthesis protein TsaE